MRLSLKGSCASALALASAGVATLKPQVAEASCVTPNIVRASMIVDVETGNIVAQHGRVDTAFNPASMIKPLTMLVILEGIDRGYYRLDQQITVRGQVALRAVDRPMIGATTTIRDALSTISASPNAVLESIINEYPGGERAFTRRMNEHLGLAGLLNANVVQPWGLMEWNSGLACDQQRITHSDYFRLFDYIYDKYPNETHELLGVSTIPTRIGSREGFNASTALLRDQNTIRQRYQIEIDEAKTGIIRYSGAGIFVSYRDLRNGRRYYAIETGLGTGDCQELVGYSVRDCAILRSMLARDGRTLDYDARASSNASGTTTITRTPEGTLRMTWGASIIPASISTPPAAISPPSAISALPETTPVRLPRRIDSETVQLWTGNIIRSPAQGSVDGRSSSVPREYLRGGGTVASPPSPATPIPVS